MTTIISSKPLEYTGCSLEIVILKNLLLRCYLSYLDRNKGNCQLIAVLWNSFKKSAKLTERKSTIS